MQKAAMLRLAERWHLLLIATLALSAFTHLWNPTGFPDVFYDEGIYMRRAMHVLEGLGPQERTFYDHPYFGQLFLASVFWLSGYPDSVNPVIQAADTRAGWERIQATKHCLLLAENLATAGRKNEAAKIYQHLVKTRTDPAEAYIREAATRALTRPAGVPVS